MRRGFTGESPAPLCDTAHSCVLRMQAGFWLSYFPSSALYGIFCQAAFLWGRLPWDGGSWLSLTGDQSCRRPQLCSPAASPHAAPCLLPAASAAARGNSWQKWLVKCKTKKCYPNSRKPEKMYYYPLRTRFSAALLRGSYTSNRVPINRLLWWAGVNCMGESAGTKCRFWSQLYWFNSRVMLCQYLIWFGFS